MKRVIIILLISWFGHYSIAAPVKKPKYSYLPDQVVVKLANKTSDVYSVTVFSQRISLAKGFVVQKNNEVLPVKKDLHTNSYPKFEKSVSQLMPMGVLDTLIWVDVVVADFGGWTKDYFLEYFIPAADGILHSITFNMSDLPEFDGGGMSVWIYNSNYAWPEISTSTIADVCGDANLGYYEETTGKEPFGTNWVNGGINAVEGAIADKKYDPLGAKAWPMIGAVAVSLPPNADDGGFVTCNLLDMGSEYNFTQGDTFLVVIRFNGFPDEGDDNDYRIGFLSGSGDIEPQPAMKFYGTISSPTGPCTEDDWGWYIHSYIWDWRCNVEYTGDRGPKIAVDILYTTVSQNARTVTAIITDDNPSGGAAGFDEALLMYSVNSGEYQSVAMTAAGDVYSADIPGQAPGTEVSYYVTAKDVGGLTTNSLPYTYGIYLPTAGVDILVVWNNNDFPWSYDLGGYTIVDLYLYPESFSGMTYDVWDAWNWGPLSTELLDNYKVVVDVGMGGPRWGGVGGGVEDIQAWLEAGTTASEHMYALFAQDYGFISGYCDTTFAAGSFEYDFLGVETLGPQDYNYDGTVSSYERPFKIIASADDEFVDDWNVFQGDSLAMYYYPLWGIGFSNWIDVIIPTTNAIPQILDPDGKVNGVRVDGTGWKTMYWTLDLLCVDFWNPAYADTLSSDNASSKVEGAMYHWAITDVSNPLTQWIATRTNAVEAVSNVAKVYKLSQNYPNPFNPTTNIEFAVREAANIQIVVYNMLGRRVAELTNETYQPGHYQVMWNGKDISGNDVSSGIYFYRMTTGNFTKTNKMIFLK